MNNTIISFTKKGFELALLIKEKRIFDTEPEICIKSENKYDTDLRDIVKISGSLADFVYDRQQKKYTVIFIGAAGIAVRMIARGIENKLKDSPVIVIDETGKFVIPILAGHYGGGNEAALKIAEAINAIPVITTATDNEGAFAADLFAKENNLAIMNKDAIKRVSAKALEGKPVRICMENYPANSDVIISSYKTNASADSFSKEAIGEKVNSSGNDEFMMNCEGSYVNHGGLKLCPKVYALGVGCRKDTDADKFRAFILDTLMNEGIDINLVGAVGSIDLKVEEEAIISFSREFGIPFITFDADLLNKARGNFKESDFVKEKTGVGNVCERAAALLTDNQGQIVVKKTACDGMTLAVAKI